MLYDTILREIVIFKNTILIFWIKTYICNFQIHLISLKLINPIWFSLCKKSLQKLTIVSSKIRLLSKYLHKQKGKEEEEISLFSYPHQ